MATDLDRLSARARGAYERGRLYVASRRAVVVLPVAIAMVALCRYPSLGVAAATLLVAMAVAFHWRGRVWSRAVKPGLVAGIAPLALPPLALAFGHLCTSTVCWQICIASCVGAGFGAGVFVGVQAARLKAGRGRFLLAAGAIATVVGAPACAFAGLFGVGGMVAGLTAGMGPAMVLAAERT